MKFLIYCSIIIVLSSQVLAAGGSDSWSSDSPRAESLKTAIKSKNWNDAIKLLELDIVEKIATADTYNFLGYAQRNLGNYEIALKHYSVALKMDPDHKGAHEYVGETYLAVGNLEMAEKHLSELDRICFFGCQEFNDLKSAINIYRSK